MSGPFAPGTRIALDPTTAAGRRGDAGSSAPEDEAHPVGCIYCRGVFDLFRASWCRHRSLHPSKICPQCTRCLCGHMMYEQPDLWKDAPPVFRKYGFRKLFVLYL